MHGSSEPWLWNQKEGSWLCHFTDMTWDLHEEGLGLLFLQGIVKAYTIWLSPSN